jgi:hypothetical protein
LKEPKSTDNDPADPGFYRYRDVAIKLTAVDCVGKGTLFQAVKDKWESGFYYDFGTETSPVMDGYDKLTDEDSMWQSDVVGLGSADRGSGSDLRRDLVNLESGTLIVPTSNGTCNQESDC